MSHVSAQLRQTGSDHCHRQLLTGNPVQCSDDGGQLVFFHVLEFVREQAQSCIARSRGLSRNAQQRNKVVLEIAAVGQTWLWFDVEMNFDVTVAHPDTADETGKRSQSSSGGLPCAHIP